ncbi:MAG TPA: trypsin-like peptidase domain-containing protein [Chthoniobacterales bacterium]
MKSILRFLIFIVVAALAVSTLYFWRLAQDGEPGPPPLPADPPAPAGSRLEGLAALDEEFVRLVSDAKQSVVSITARQQVQVALRTGNAFQPFRSLGQLQLQPNLGSGVVVSRQGHIITNVHVIRGANEIDARLNDGRIYPATVLGVDPATDLAVLKIDADNLLPMPLANSDLVRSGQMVFAVGNPYGLHETVTQGIISGIGRTSSEAANEFFQTDTAVNPGNSGGPLINLRGEVIGINNAIHTNTGAWQGISFAIPSNTVRRVFDDIRSYGRVIRTWLGVESDLPRTVRGAAMPGVRIQSVLEGSPAQKSGLLPEDVIVEFNGKPVNGLIDLRNRVLETEAGQQVGARVLRDGFPVNLNLIMEEYPRS